MVISPTLGFQPGDLITAAIAFAFFTFNLSQPGATDRRSGSGTRVSNIVILR
jgi:hypothetical protein